MRQSTRLLAAVQRTLEPGNPTGLTGLHTLIAPRSTLIHLYSSTLSQLSQIPASSVYRQSTEALTKKRLAIIESTKPPGFDSWQDRVRYQINKFREQAAAEGKTVEEGLVYGGKEFVMAQMGDQEVDARDVEWDGKFGDNIEKPLTEGPRDEEFRNKEREMKNTEYKKRDTGRIVIEAEPALTLEQ
jgi:NADH dehydrogenase (ubiquinone) 1 alpha subcomplex subunit 5